MTRAFSKACIFRWTSGKQWRRTQRRKDHGGGRVVSYSNVGRRLTNSEFITLISGAWVGTTVPQSSLLEKVVRSVLQTKSTLTLAIQPNVPPPEVNDDEEEEEGEEEEEEEADEL